ALGGRRWSWQPQPPAAVARRRADSCLQPAAFLHPVTATAVGRRDAGEQRSEACGARCRRRCRRCADDVAELQVSRDRGDNDASLDRDQVDADERDADPGIDDDALVEHPIENLDEAIATSGALNPHSQKLPPVARSCSQRNAEFLQGARQFSIDGYLRAWGRRNWAPRGKNLPHL